MKGLLHHRVNRSLLLVALAGAAVGSLLLALVSAALVLQMSVNDVERDTDRIERDLEGSLTSFQPLYELQRQLQIAASSRDVRTALVVDASGRVLAASDSALVGRSLAELQQDGQADLVGHIRDCQAHHNGCQSEDSITLHQGPLPFIGGDHLLRFRSSALALQGLPAFGSRALLVIDVDLHEHLDRVSDLALRVFLIGLVPLFVTAGGVALVVQRRLLPELLSLAQLDGLSGVLNRRAFMESATHRLEMDRAVSRPVVVALIDVDYFKSINDQLGHAAGDEVIITIANRLVQSVRRSDLVGRLGGDEFALLVGAPALPAYELLERLRQQMAQTELQLSDGRSVQVTLSIGMVEAGTAGRHELSELLHAADAALYVAKDEGRNTVVDMEYRKVKGWRTQAG